MPHQLHKPLYLRQIWCRECFVRLSRDIKADYIEVEGESMILGLVPARGGLNSLRWSGNVQGSRSLLLRSKL